MAFATGIAAALGLGVLIAVFLTNLLRLKTDPREPPVIHPKIPFIGHIIGLIRHGGSYFSKISSLTNAPIVTLPMLNGRSYICLDPTIATHIMRSPKTLSFDPIVIQMMPRMVGASDETRETIRDAKAVLGKPLLDRSHEIINPPLFAGKISGISETQLGLFSDAVNNLNDGDTIDPFHWATRTVTSCAMRTFYGPNNPFAKHPHLVERFWDWDRGMANLMMRILPQWTARSSYLGLEECVQKFEEYLRDGHMAEAYSLLQARDRMHDEYAIPVTEKARLEMGMAFGFNSNASITTFWVLNNVFSRPELLAELRAEICDNAMLDGATISYAKIRDNCPLLTSIVRETLRLYNPMLTPRLVTQDTLIADTYLLRKDSVVQIAGGVLHSDSSVWGPDAATFNPRRFLDSTNGVKTGSSTSEKEDAVPASAFRAFGGGSHLCPGRFFAQMEIASLAALMVMSVDFVAPEGGGAVAWNIEPDVKVVPIGTLKPVRGFEVRVKRRPGRWMARYE